MTRKIYFWIILFVLSCLAAVFSVRYFDKAFPIVNIDIKMDRKAALSEAKKLDTRYGWGPDGFRQVASFNTDSYVRDYVELEAGGQEAFSRMLKEKMYYPYTWNVRHYKSGTTRETIIAFTPEGSPYGFYVKVPEKEQGKNLSVTEARSLAENLASKDWNINFNDFVLVEQSKKQRTGGRMDHTFVYERPSIKIGDGTYRLQLTVSGDKFTQLKNFIKVPEAFGRRFENMRSANNIIASGASISFAIFYIFGGCIIALFLLLRKKLVIWRQPVYWGVGIAFFQLLTDINNWPLTWLSYDTAISYGGFILQQSIGMLSNFITDAALLTASFMAAEGLSRKAFPDHIQFWRLLSPGIVNSKAVAGRTLAGYLLACIFIAYQIVLYFTTRKMFGWWTPSDTLFDPDILASYFPWFNSVAAALHAGLWEECLFRAVPIAGAAIIGEKFGKRNLWIIGALIIQAVIFGAAHAGYANQPAYARLVELIIPSLGFGLLYIYFGLLPGIILHFVFDVTLMSMPLFVESVPGIRLNQIIVIVLAMIPVWLIVKGILQHGLKEKIDEFLLNRSWKAAEIGSSEPIPIQEREIEPISRYVLTICIILGCVGLITWFAVTRFKSDVPSIKITRSEAVKISNTAIQKEGINLPAIWKTMSIVSANSGNDDRFVWEEGKKDVYQKLMSYGYLRPPSWEVRYAKFKGDIAERAEEYNVSVSGDGKIIDISHQLPEGRAGKSLTEEQARRLVYSAIRNKYNLDPQNLFEISAVADKLPNRLDWTFEFSNQSEYQLSQGQARISVKLSGDELVDTYRYIFVPEQWERDQRNKNTVLRGLQGLSSIIMFLIFLGGLSVSIIAWSKKKLSIPVFLWFFILLLVFQLINLINGWQSSVFGFSTAEPFMNQSLIKIGYSLLFGVFSAFAVSAINAYLEHRRNSYNPVSRTRSICLGVGWAIFLAGITALANKLLSTEIPVWPSFSTLDASVSIIENCISSLRSLIIQTTLFLFIFSVIEHYTERWTKRTAIFSVITILIGFVVMVTGYANTVPAWFVSGVIVGAAMLFGYIYIFRFNLYIIPIATGTLAIMSSIRQAVFQAYPMAFVGEMLAIIFISAFAYFWFKHLYQER